MSPTAGDETSRGKNPENGRCRGFGRRWHRQSGFQYTYRPRPSSPELFNKNFLHVIRELWKCTAFRFSSLMPHLYAGSHDMVFSRGRPQLAELTSCDFFLWKTCVPADLPGLRSRIVTAVESITPDMLTNIWEEFDYRLDVCHVKNSAHIGHLKVGTPKFRELVYAQIFYLKPKLKMCFITL